MAQPREQQAPPAPGAAGAAAADVLGSAELLPLVLAHVPLADRLHACAHVSRAWHAAAAAATSTVEIYIPSARRAHPQRRARQLSAWLGARGQHVRSLTAESFLKVDFSATPSRTDVPRGSVAIALPVEQLAQRLGSLALNGSALCLAPVAATGVPAPAGLAALRHVTRLTLERCRVPRSVLASISALRQLQVLQLEAIGVPAADAAAASDSAGSIDSATSSDSASSGDSAGGAGHADPGAGGGPGPGADDSVGAVLGSVLPHLLQLQTLELIARDAVVDPDLEPAVMPSGSLDARSVSAMPQLQRLALNWERAPDGSLAVLPPGLTALCLDRGPAACACASMPPGLRKLRLGSHHSQPAAAGVGALLAGALPRLSCLQSLEASEADLAAWPAAQLSLLTAASTALTSLWLWRCQLPAGGSGGCCAAMFAAPLPQLRAVSLLEVEPLLQPAGVQRLVAACPGLDRLGLDHSLVAGCAAELACLTQLAGSLRSLSVGGRVVSDALACDVLTALSRLSELELRRVPRFTERGLVALTALTSLQSVLVEAPSGLSDCTLRAAADVRGPSADDDELELSYEELLELVHTPGSASLELLLASRERQLASRERQLASRERQLASRERQLQAREAAVQAREAQLQAREAQLPGSELTWDPSWLLSTPPPPPEL